MNFFLLCNDSYDFEELDKFIIESQINKSENKEDILYNILQNCKNITNHLNVIIEYYKNIDINYYNNLKNIFNKISTISEGELFNYFYRTFFRFNHKTTSKMNKSDIMLNIGALKRKNIFEKLSIKKIIKK